MDIIGISAAFAAAVIEPRVVMARRRIDRTFWLQCFLLRYSPESFIAGNIDCKALTAGPS
jgi:hypothetical protein